MRRRGRDQFADEFVAHRAAEKRDRRIVPDLGCELRGVAGGDVGKIGHDQIEGAFDRFEEIALHEMDSVRNAEALRIFAGQSERVGREIDRVQFRVRKPCREGEGDDAAAGPDIEHARIGWPGQVAEIFDQLLGFGARNERAFIGDEMCVGEFDRAEKMLERLALAAPPDEFAQRGQLGLGERALELEIKFDPLFA